ncbi:MAG: sulfite exporter TauE/SafE family protein [Bacteroidia bacterium]|jgi:uncharacterized membrane protein YfcA|nr:sulfite exporter TauE/SafE family protein [Bacteroidia bacterium]
MEGYQLLILALIGLLAGVLSGLLGIGGAIIIIPALVFMLGYTQQAAQGTTLLMMVLPVGALAAWQYYQEGHVNLKAAGVMALLFFLGGFLGAKMAVMVPQELLKKGFAVFLVFLGIKMLFFSK